MNVKKLKSTLTVLFMALIAVPVWGQKLYLNLDAGYGFPMNTQSQFLENYTYNENGFEVENIHLSLGEGFQFGGALGVMFNKHIGIEAGVTYLKGNTTTGEWISDYSESYISVRSNMLNITPGIVVAAGFDRVNPYAKFGMVIGSGKIILESEEYYDGDEMFMKMVLNDGIAYGVNAGLGANVNLSDRIAIFGEVYSRNLAYSPKRGEITEYTWNGEDQLADMEVYDKQMVFVDEMKHSYDDPVNETEPSEELGSKYPFGTIGVKIGLRIGF